MSRCAWEDSAASFRWSLEPSEGKAVLISLSTHYLTSMHFYIFLLKKRRRQFYAKIYCTDRPDCYSLATHTQNISDNYRSIYLNIPVFMAKPPYLTRSRFHHRNTLTADSWWASPRAQYSSMCWLCALMCLHFWGSVIFAPKGNMIDLAIGLCVKRSKRLSEPI